MSGGNNTQGISTELACELNKTPWLGGERNPAGGEEHSSITILYHRGRIVQFVQCFAKPKAFFAGNTCYASTSGGEILLHVHFYGVKTEGREMASASESSKPECRPSGDRLRLAEDEDNETLPIQRIRNSFIVDCLSVRWKQPRGSCGAPC